MKILITNDDGIHAEGIKVLRKALKDLGEVVVVVAPDREQSATGHSITMQRPIMAKEVFFADGLKSWSVDGTPSDCVKLAFDALLDFKPDLVVSGINAGANLGTDVLYSGTVSAAIEGFIYGVPSIAVSVVPHENPNFQGAAEITRRLIKEIQSHQSLPAATLFNVNFPDATLEEVTGVTITKLGIRRYKDIFDRRVDPRGRVYYWLAGEIIDDDEDDPDTDTAAINRKEVSVTPLQFDLTNHQILRQIKDWQLNLCQPGKFC